MSVLAAPFASDWTIEGLAEQLLATIASQAGEGAADLLLDGALSTDRQTQRILRPLLACLAAKSAAEAGAGAGPGPGPGPGAPPNLYGGLLRFKRTGPDGPVWILADFENRPGSVRIAFHRTGSPPENHPPTSADLSPASPIAPVGSPGVAR